MLLLVISRIAGKGKVANDAADDELLSHYRAALEEDGLIVKLCEMPLELVSAVSAGKDACVLCMHET